MCFTLWSVFQGQFSTFEKFEKNNKYLRAFCKVEKLEHSFKIELFKPFKNFTCRIFFHVINLNNVNFVDLQIF